MNGWDAWKEKNLLFMEIVCKRSNLRTLKHVLVPRASECYQNRIFPSIQSTSMALRPLCFHQKNNERNLFWCKLA